MINIISQQASQKDISENKGDDSLLNKCLRNSVPVLLAIFIFLNPFPHITAAKEICFYLSILITFYLVASRKISFSFRTPFLLPGLMFAIWSFASIFWGLNKENSIHDFYSHLIKYIILYYLLINFFQTRKSFEVLSWTIFVSAVLFSIWGIWYFYIFLGNSLQLRFATGGLRQVGLLNQTPINIVNVIAVFGIVIASFFLINSKKIYVKGLAVVSFIPLIGVVILSQTRGAILASLVSISLLLPRYKKTGLVVLSCLLLGIGFFPVQDRLSHTLHIDNSIDHARIGIWHTTWEVIKDYPLQGIGFGIQTYGESIDLKSYQKRVAKEHRKHSLITDPHNIFLDITVRLGVVGAALFLWLLGTVYTLGVNTIRKSDDRFVTQWAYCLLIAVTSFLVFSLFSPVFTHSIEVVFCSLIAMCTIISTFPARQSEGGKEAVHVHF